MDERNQGATGTKHSPTSERKHSQRTEQLANQYAVYLQNRNRKNIENDEATEWFNGATAVLKNPSDFGLTTSPVTDLPTINQFIEACKDCIRQAA